MADSYLLTKKTGNNIAKCLQSFIDLYGIPNEFSSDNWREFVNNEVTNFCNKNNINLKSFIRLPFKEYFFYKKFRKS